MRKTHPDTLAGVKAMFADMADPKFAAAIDAVEGSWVPDPQVPMVWGFRRESDGQVLVVAYLEECDFEPSEAALSLLG